SAEDYDLSVKLADGGFGNVYHSDVLAQYRVWGGTQWSDQRRMLEIEALTQIFDKRIEPAFERRGWGLRMVKRFRRQKASELSIRVGKSYLSTDQRNKISKQLLGLSNSPLVACYVWLYNHGAGNILMRLSRLRVSIRKHVKRLAIRLSLARIFRPIQTG